MSRTAVYPERFNVVEARGASDDCLVKCAKADAGIFEATYLYASSASGGPGLDRDGEETYYETGGLRKRAQLRRGGERNEKRDPDENEARSK